MNSAPNSSTAPTETMHEPTAGPRPGETEEPVATEAATEPPVEQPTEEAVTTTAEPQTPEPVTTTVAAPLIAPIVRSGSPAASLNQTYTVRFGDTLSRIALRLDLDAGALTSLNGFAGVDAPLNAGDTLLLPATGDELRPSTPAQEHIVSPGESLSAIAQS